jgi:hypothetical protein
MLFTALMCGCVERSFTIATEPPGAQIILDGQEIGESPQTVEFVHYGTHEIIIRKDRYETFDRYEPIDAPWWQLFPIDLFAELFYPGTLRDHRDFNYTLKLAAEIDDDTFKRAFLERADVTIKQIDTSE